MRGDDDLRATGTPGSDSSSRSSGPYPGQTQSYSEFVDSSGIVGIRAVAKVVDYMLAGIIASFVVTPFYLTWFFSNYKEFFEEPMSNDPEAFPSEFFADFLLIWGLMLLFNFVLLTAYHFVLEWKFQRTAGKKAFDLRVVDENGGKPPATRLLVRSMLYSFALLTYLWIVEFLVMLVREDERTLTDQICGTRVIRIRKVYHYPPGWSR